MTDGLCRTEYLCRDEDGDELVYVPWAGTHESMRLFRGRLGEPLREVEVRAVERLRDGGTTFITTSEGYFYAPARASTSWLCGVSG